MPKARCCGAPTARVATVRNETVGNLSHLAPHVIDGIRAMLAGKTLVDLDEEFEIERSLPQGHVACVLGVRARSTWST